MISRPLSRYITTRHTCQRPALPPIDTGQAELQLRRQVKGAAKGRSFGREGRGQRAGQSQSLHEGGQGRAARGWGFRQGAGLQPIGAGPTEPQGEP